MGVDGCPVSHSFLWQMCARHHARPCKTGSSLRQLGPVSSESLQSRGSGRKEGEVRGHWKPRQQQVVVPPAENPWRRREGVLVESWGWWVQFSLETGGRVGVPHGILYKGICAVCLLASLGEGVVLPANPC